MKPSRPKALLIDLDGVVFRGDQPLAGAARLLGRLAGRPHCFITNNPIRTPEEIAAACTAMGLPSPEPRHILTSALATARWLSRERPDLRYFAVGAGGLEAALSAVGQPDACNANVVVIGEGAGLDYDSLTTGINLVLSRGARLVATNPDTTVDGVRDGRHLVLPGCGALVAPFTAATGVTPTIIGKPEPLLYEMALEQLDCLAADCLMIGDRPDTDIAGAARLGIQTALVRTGRFPPGRRFLPGQPRPNFDVPDLPALMDALERTYPGLLAAS